MNRLAVSLTAISLALAAPAFAQNSGTGSMPMPADQGTPPAMTAPSAPAAAPAASEAAPAAPSDNTAPSDNSAAAPSSDTTDAAAAPKHHHHHHKAAGDTQNSMAATKALNALVGAGYGDFSNFQANGDNYTATVMQNGKSSNVMIDSSGKVTPQ